MQPIKTLGSLPWMMRPALKTPNTLASGVCRSTNGRHYQSGRHTCQMVSGGGRGLGPAGRAARRSPNSLPETGPAGREVQLHGLNEHHHQFMVVGF